MTQTTRSRQLVEVATWDILNNMADQDDVVGFYKAYAGYLEWNNVISRERQSIHKMALRVVEILESQNVMLQGIQKYNEESDEDEQ